MIQLSEEEGLVGVCKGAGPCHKLVGRKRLALGVHGGGEVGLEGLAGSVLAR